MGAGYLTSCQTTKGPPLNSRTKCQFCGAVFPKPPKPPTCAETYKELREQIGKLEYDYSELEKANAALSNERKKVENRLIQTVTKLKESEYHASRKSLSKWVAIFFFGASWFWFLVVMISL